MLRLFTRAVQHAPILSGFNGVKIPSAINRVDINKFSTLSLTNVVNRPLLANSKVQDISFSITRNVAKYSWGKGKRKTVGAVLKRFYRLNWGMWIHTKCGRHKKIWAKHAARKRRLRQHVFCNASQSLLLDKMVNRYWRKPKYYIDDPYEPYQQREEFMFTYTKPKPFDPSMITPSK